MARRTDPAPHLSRTLNSRRRSRSAAESHRLSGLAPQPTQVPRPREDADATTSEHPIMHWVLITDENGRTRPEARWL
ncbi:hypothetical protein [Nocardiopsis sp. MG754419]|uniref:hypothetical protein n=1 Tax=Nocardiopsis sp. MG754419 TaxID=2259865 RepID=UPI001BA6C125|nr:hypothetical protein [Nocardiopsis sp. MG754419]MBR8741408.1 hypothetical protein [Nocardiopsis sp. MG754419]